MHGEAPAKEPYTGGGAVRGNVRQMSSIQAGTESLHQSAVLGGLRNARHPPCFSYQPSSSFNPLYIPCKSSPSSLPLLSSSYVLACLFPTCQRAPLCLSLDLISDCPCQWVCWCFLLYFHLSLFCRAYQRLLTALAVRYLSTVYLAETFSHRRSSHKTSRLV